MQFFTSCDRLAVMNSERFRGVTNNGKPPVAKESFLSRLAKMHASAAPKSQPNFRGETIASASDLQALKGDGRIGVENASPAQIARVIGSREKLTNG